MLFLLLLAPVAFANPLSQTLSNTDMNCSEPKPEPNGVIWVLGSSVCPSELKRAGYEYSTTLYVGRGKVQGEWVPGKGYYKDRIFTVKVPYGGRVSEITDAQVSQYFLSCFLFKNRYN